MMRAALHAVADEVLMRRVGESPSAARMLGFPAKGLHSLASQAVEDAAQFARAMLDRLAMLDEATLDERDRCFHDALRHDLENKAAAPIHHGHQFFVAPYLAGDQHRAATLALSGQPLATAEDRETMIALARDYARLLREMADHTREQASRGIRLPRPAIPGARETLAVAATQCADLFDPRKDSGVEATLDAILKTEIRPAFDDLQTVLDDDYAAKAPENVGLAQYPGGAEAYRQLIRERADSDLEPEAIHRLGLEMIAELEDAKAALRAECWPGRNSSEVNAIFRSNPGWQPSSPDEIEASFVHHLDTIRPKLSGYFRRLPQAPWGVKRADPTTEAGTNYGYYQMPSPVDPSGWYRYNGSGLDQRSLIGAAHLIYHELVPGHHLQLALQMEQPAAHPLGMLLTSTGYVEGWAVYASDLAREMGAYAPEDLYGHYLMQSFLAARLVVDTGLNALGWTLDRAFDFVMGHCFEGEDLVRRELLRYSTDIPAQALAYMLGRHAIGQLRDSAAAAAGDRFAIQGFHDAVLEVGGVPLPVLEARIARLGEKASVVPWVS